MNFVTTYFNFGSIKTDETNIKRKVEYYENGAVYCISNHNERGTLHGEFLQFFRTQNSENGNLMMSLNYKCGIKHGKYIRYAENGDIINDILFVNGKREGRCLVNREWGYYKEDKEIDINVLNGEYREYYNNGNLKCYKHYIDNVLDGEYISYYLNFKTKTKCSYKEGLLHGQISTYYHNGKVHKQCTYKNGIKDGEYLEYGFEGNILINSSFKNGKLNGEYYKFNDYKIKIIANMKDDEFHGRYIDKYDTGNNRMVCHYKNGILDGEMTVYDRDGVCIKKYNYMGGKMDGYSEDRDRVGIKRIRKYDEGNKILDLNYSDIPINDREYIGYCFKKIKIYTN